MCNEFINMDYFRKEISVPLAVNFYILKIIETAFNI